MAAALVATFGAVAPPARCPGVTTAELRASATATVQWFVRNQHADGRWLYEWDERRRAATPEYNVVRHAGVVMGLYQAAVRRIDGALASADAGLAWAQRRLERRHGWAALSYRGDTPTGSSALLAAGLVDRRAATGDLSLDDDLRALGRFLAAQVEPSGAVTARYDLDADAPVAGSRSAYYTGEAYWALARLAAVFPDDGFGEVAGRVGRYLATVRDREEGHWPPIPDHWVAYGLAERPPDALTAAELAYARRQAGLFGAQVRWVSERMGPWGRLVRGSYVPRGGGYGVVGEALTGLWLVARSQPALADLAAPIGERARCIAALAVDAQRRAGPSEVEGAWFKDGTTRMDDQQHVLAALLRTEPIVASSRAPTDPEAPSVWLWALALVAVAVPTRVRDRRPIALAGLAPAAVLVALSGPILDALDVSRPSMRTAAAGVVIVTAVADLVRRRGTGPDLPAWLALARPAVLVAAIAAGADAGVAAALAMLAAIGAAALGATRLPDAGRRWASEAFAALALAGGVALLIDGVLAV